MEAKPVRKMFKISILGAAGGVGQSLSFVVKSYMYDLVNEMSLYDVRKIDTVTDLRHIATPMRVNAYVGAGMIGNALSGSDVVIILAGIARKPGMTSRDCLWGVNSMIVADLSTSCAEHCPQAHILVITNPVNSLVPVVREVLKQKGVKDPSVFGITTIDNVRSKHFVSDMKGVDPCSMDIKVIGGHSSSTMVPIFSQMKPRIEFTQSELENLVSSIRSAGDQVVKEKDEMGSSIFAMAYAANLFLRSLLSALSGDNGTVDEVAYVYSDQWKTESKYFSGIIELGKDGLQNVRETKHISEFESKLYEKAIKEIDGEVNKGLEFVKNVYLRKGLE